MRLYSRLDLLKRGAHTEWSTNSDRFGNSCSRRRSKLCFRCFASFRVFQPPTFFKTSWFLDAFSELRPELSRLGSITRETYFHIFSVRILTWQWLLGSFASQICHQSNTMLALSLVQREIWRGILLIRSKALNSNWQTVHIFRKHLLRSNMYIGIVETYLRRSTQPNHHNVQPFSRKRNLTNWNCIKAREHKLKSHRPHCCYGCTPKYIQVYAREPHCIISRIQREMSIIERESYHIFCCL